MWEEEVMKEVKKTLAVLQTHSLRDMVGAVNTQNKTDCPILREDIITLLKEDETYFMLYYK